LSRMPLRSVSPGVRPEQMVPIGLDESRHRFDKLVG
jgi:hypothetical protein